MEKKDKKAVWPLSGKNQQSRAEPLLDCETNNALAAEIMGVRYLLDPEEEENEPEPEAESDDWLGVDDDYI